MIYKPRKIKVKKHLLIYKFLVLKYYKYKKCFDIKPTFSYWYRLKWNIARRAY